MSDRPSPQPCPSVAAPWRRAWLRRATRLAGAAAWLAALGGLTGCGREPPLRIAYHPWPGYAPLELARHMGWWTNGPAIEAVRTAAATQSVEQLRAGAVHAAALTLDEAIRVHAEGLPLSVVALFNQSVGADVVMGGPPPSGGVWRRGLRIGHEAGMVGELMAHSWLERVGLRYAEVTPVHITPDAHERAWNRGDMDVLVTYEPVASRLRARGVAVLFDSRELPRERPILDVLVVRKDALSANGRGLHTLVRTLLDGQRHLKELPVDSAYRLAPWLGVPRDDVAGTFRGLRLIDWAGQREWLAGPNPRLAAATRGLATFMTTLHGDYGLPSAIASLPEPVTDFLPLEAP